MDRINTHMERTHDMAKFEYMSYNFNLRKMKSGATNQVL